MILLVAGIPSLADTAGDRTSVFRVQGMTCALCAKAIERALRSVEGVRSVAVDREAERVTVIADFKVPSERLEQSIESSGSYEAEAIGSDAGRRPAAP